MNPVALNLQPRTTSDARAEAIGEGAWRLWVPAGPGGVYRLAQLDDYAQVRRSELPWRPPLTMQLRARACHTLIPGTWGFGLWNDPFSLALGFGGGTRRLPTLPNAAWFFFASPPNYLCLRDDLPAQGPLAATFCSPQLPAAALAPGTLALPLLGLRPTARLLRRLARRVIRQDAARLLFGSRHAGSAPTAWHRYTIHWKPAQTTFLVDDKPALETDITPHGPLGLVIWVDNQYAALPPDGRLAYGTLPNPEAAWIEITDLKVETG